MAITLGELASYLEIEYVGNPTLIIEKVSPFDSASLGSISLAIGNYRKNLALSNASAFIVDYKTVTEIERHQFALLLASNPLIIFAKIIEKMHVSPRLKGEIASDFVCGKGTIVGKNVTIAPRVVVGKNCYIEDNVTLSSGVILGNEVKIGELSFLHANVTIYDKVQIGNRVILHSGVVIGADGFGFARNQLGQSIKIPQIGNVVIEDDVEIGANSCVDRATLDTTRIRRGVKLDNLVHIAHNCDIGEDTVIAAQTGISGSAKIGNRVMIAGQVGTNPHITVGDDVIVAGKTGISKSIPSQKQIAGLPPISLKDWKLVNIYAAKLPKLIPELKKRIEDLEKKKQ